MGQQSLWADTEKSHTYERHAQCLLQKHWTHCHSPDGQQWRLWDLKHKSLHWMVLFIHDHHYNLLSLILHKQHQTCLIHSLMLCKNGTVIYYIAQPVFLSYVNIKQKWNKNSPSLSVAWHNGACLECTDLTQDGMTSVKLNISGQIISFIQHYLWAHLCWLML